MSVSFSPIGPWFALALASLVVMVLTVWAYQQRLKGTAGRWRWFALGLRLAAVLLCFVAALRPSVVLQEKRKQSTSVVFLLDRSLSMKITDEVNGQKRYDVAQKQLRKALDAAKNLGPDTEVKAYEFGSKISDLKEKDKSEPDGRETYIGTALTETVHRHSGGRISTIFLLSDGASNGGIPPLLAARQLRSQQIPVDTVAFGSENAGAGSRDIIVRDLVTAPTVFVKNQLQVKGTLIVRGFTNRPLDVEMYIEGQDKPVATKRVKAPEGTEVIPITGLKYIPQTAGERKVTLKVKPEEGELIQTNNEISTFVTVLKGGLNVLYLQGENFTWEFKFLYRAIGSSPDIQVDGKVLKRPATGDVGELKDEELAPGKYDVYIIGDLPADHLTKAQQRMLADAVEKGAGLMMLGGRSSFGPGGWGNTELARVLPVTLHPGDGQLEPEGGVKFVPNSDALDSYVLQIGPGRTESAQIWSELPPLPGTNRLTPKLGAIILGHAAGASPEPVMLNMDAGKGRSLAFGGETWVWARASDVGRNAHKKFWRQAIFWLSHKEDQGDNQVQLKLDSRRISVGQKIEMTVTARDAKGAPIPNLKYESKVVREGDPAKVESPDIIPQAEEARGTYYALGKPGTYKATVTARDAKNQVVGTDSVRFLVYQDDREMENPAADRAQLRQIASITGGVPLAPEELEKHLKAMGGKVASEYVTQSEKKVWDNWPFLLIFVTLLTVEWWLRKRHGWV